VSRIKNEFKKISIRGRLAYGAKCIEYYLSQYQVRHRLFSKVLDEIWKFTTSNELDKWDQRIVEFTPDCLVDNHPDNRPEDYEYISAVEFFALKRLFLESPTDLIDLIQLTIEIGTGNLYGGTGEYSQFTMRPTLEVYKITQRTLRPWPDVKSFKISPYHEFHGWGERIERTRFE